MKQIKNAASALLTLCLLAALLPAAAVPAHAENSLAEGELFVAGVDIAAVANHRIMSDTPGVSGVSAGIALAYADDDGDPVLVLTDFHYAGAGHVESDNYFTGFNAALRYKGTKPLTIVVNGENSLAVSVRNAPPRSYGVHVTKSSASLTVRPGTEAGGSLCVSSCDAKKDTDMNAPMNYGICCGDLTVEDVALTVRAGKAEGYGGYSYGILCKKLTLNGCTLDAGSGDAYRESDGVKCTGGLAVEDSTLIAAAGLTTDASTDGSYALRISGGSAEISGSAKVTATGAGTAEQPAARSCGIDAEGLIVKDSAEVTAAGGFVNDSWNGTTCGLSSSGDVTVRDSAKLTAAGGSGTSWLSEGISVGDKRLLISDSAEVTATGGDEAAAAGSEKAGFISRSAGVSLAQQNAVLVVSGGELTALGGKANGSYGVYHSIQSGVIRINGGKAVFAGETVAVDCQIANAIEGAGWEDAAGTGEMHGVPVSEEGQGPSFKRLAFPAPEEKLLSLGGALSRTVFPVGTRISCTVQNAPPDALLIAAWYDHDGRLLGAKTASIDGTGAASEEYPVNSTLVSFGTLMLVDGTTFAPLCAPSPLRW